MASDHQSLFADSYLRAEFGSERETFQGSEEEQALLVRLRHWASRELQNETSAQNGFIDRFFKQVWGYVAAGHFPTLPDDRRQKFVERETHQLWGRHHLLHLVEKDAKPAALDYRRITLSVRPGTDLLKRSEILRQWHLRLLHEAIPPIIESWSQKLKVSVAGYFLQCMKTRWGSCDHRIGHIRLNTELVKKPKDLLEYVVVHEMVHLIEPTHSEHFISLLTRTTRVRERPGPNSTAFA